MDIVVISPRWRITIPSNVQRALKIKSGQQFAVIAYMNHAALVPVMPFEQARGFLTGIDTTVERDE